jgi:autotransporter family porin
VHSTGGELVVTNCALFANRVVGGSSPSSPVINGDGGMGSGGAFSVSNAVLFCRRTMFGGNRAEGGFSSRYGRAGDGQGGSVFSLGSIVFHDCIFSNNVSRGGGGPLQSGNGYGGAAYSAGTLEISGSTLAGNAAVGALAGGTAHGGGSGSGYGGGIFNAGIVMVTNSTLLSNQAEGGSGSALLTSLDQGLDRAADCF